LRNFHSRAKIEEIIEDISCYYQKNFKEEFLKREYIKPYEVISKFKLVNLKHYEKEKFLHLQNSNDLFKKFYLDLGEAKTESLKD